MSRRKRSQYQPTHQGRLGREYDTPSQWLLEGRKPIPASTQTAQVVKPYTNARGKYEATATHVRSTVRAKDRALRLGEEIGEPGDAIYLLYSASTISIRLHG